MSVRPVIVWFRQDLRVSDHAALHAAAGTQTPVIPVYVLDDSIPWPLGGASRWCLHHSLDALASGCASLGFVLEAAFERDLSGLGIEARRFPGALLLEPEAVRTAAGERYRVFTPFSRASQRLLAHLDAPWLVPEAEGIRPGGTLDYPPPIVDHEDARARALAAFRRTQEAR